jgi:hypothetical protein
MSAEDPDTLAEARADVERTREELADTVEALAYKADVKARARDKVDEVKQTATQKVDDVKQTAEQKVGEIRADPPPKTQLVAAAAIGLAIIAVVLWRKGSR